MCVYVCVCGQITGQLNWTSFCVHYACMRSNHSTTRSNMKKGKSKKSANKKKGRWNKCLPYVYICTVNAMYANESIGVLVLSFADYMWPHNDWEAMNTLGSAIQTRHHHHHHHHHIYWKTVRQTMTTKWEWMNGWWIEANELGRKRFTLSNVCIRPIIIIVIHNYSSRQMSIYVYGRLES